MTDKKPENTQPELETEADAAEPTPEEHDADDVTEIKLPDPPAAESAPSTPTPAEAPLAVQTKPEPAKLELHKPEELLENITTPLVVELGRVSLNILAVGDLKTGSVIELARTPSDAVDLVIGGKGIGKGELVEIEGELGVRIISLIK